MLLNRASYGGRQNLSRACVAAMTRQQLDGSIPAIMPVLRDGKRVELDFRGASYGYGVFVFGVGDRFGANGALNSLSAFGHAGYGGAFIWPAPERAVVGVYLK